MEMYLCTRVVLITIYFILVKLFGLFIRYSEYLEDLLCYDCTETEVDSQYAIFDYIIVGCGSAGALIARRLAEDKNVKVLIIEAGKHGNSLLDIPSIGLLLQKTNFDWQYVTVQQSTSCFALNDNVSHWPMGKIVGGTSMLNNMIYVRGHPEDFREWFKGKEKYDYVADVLPYFEKLEDRNIQDEQRGSIYVGDISFTSLLPEFMLGAAKALGFHITEDTTNCRKGFGLPKINIRRGARSTTSHRLLDLNKKNIILRTNRIVEKVLMHDNFEAYGVKYSFLGKSYYAKASKGVILSAGVIGTPKILMLSGIGPRDHLKALNISAKVNLPVGENLQDHITTGFDLVLLNQTIGIGIEKMLSPYSIFEYFWQGKGSWTTCGCEVLAFVDMDMTSSNQNNSMQPDLQFMVMPLGINEDNGVHLRHLMGISDDTWNNYFSLLNHTTTITILPILLHPKSRGVVLLRDANFKSMPIIDPKYLSDPDDVEVLLKGINLLKKLIHTDSMRKLGAKLNRNIFPGCGHFPFDSKDYWECYIKHLTMTSYHPVGTCKMGHEKDPTSVVNFDFQVKGTNNLFVVDASIMPSLTSGNINGPVLMLAEMASDVIKIRNYLSKKNCNIKDMFIPKGVC